MAFVLPVVTGIAALGTYLYYRQPLSDSKPNGMNQVILDITQFDKTKLRRVDVTGKRYIDPSMSTLVFTKADILISELTRPDNPAELKRCEPVKFLPPPDDFIWKLKNKFKYTLEAASC